MNIIYFDSAAEFRRWLEAYHASESELIVGFHKKGTGRPTLTWPESVDEALCFGWIDGVRRSVDAERYTIRFTPRKPKSHWSAVNLRRIEELRAEGRLAPAGLAAYESRDPEKAGRYSYERTDARLDEESEALLRADARAWAFWESQPPSYRKPAAWWVISAKRPETRARRLATLIADCAAGVRIAQLRRP